VEVNTFEVALFLITVPKDFLGGAGRARTDDPRISF